MGKAEHDSRSAASHGPANQVVDVIKKWSIQHPLQIPTVGDSNIDQQSAGVLPKCKDDSTRVVPTKPARDIHLDQQRVKPGGCWGKSVPSDLLIQDFGRGPGIGNRGVCFLVFSTEIFANGVRELSGVKPSVEGQGIDDSPSGHSKREARSGELRGQKRQIEACDPEPGQITVVEDPGQFFRDPGEGRGVDHIVIGDSVDAGGWLWDRDPRIDTLVIQLMLAAREQFQHGHFNHSINGRIDSGGLQIEDSERAVEIQVFESVAHTSSPLSS